MLTPGRVLTTVGAVGLLITLGACIAFGTHGDVVETETAFVCWVIEVCFGVAMAAGIYLLDEEDPDP